MASPPEKPSPPPLPRFKRALGVEILDAIGSTEILHMFIRQPPGRCPSRLQRQIIDRYEARIADEHQPSR